MNTYSGKSLRAGASTTDHYANQALDHAETVLDSTRGAIERASDRVRDLRFGAKDLASRGLHGVSDATAAAQKQFGRYADMTGRYVSEQPLRSALIAAAIGAGIAAMVLAARRRSNRY